MGIIKHRKGKSKMNIETETPLLSMQECMSYLTSKGIPCKTRKTFYRMIEDFNIPYINTNPHGKHEIRRFPLDRLEEIIADLKL